MRPPRTRSHLRSARALLCLAALAASAAPAAQVRLKEVVEVQGMRDNELFGYGLVIGLAGTGDTEQVLFTSQAVAGLLGRFGARIDKRDVRVRNVAAVMVTGRLPTFARPGTRIDVNVSSIGNARSLLGGVLLLTQLNASDGQVYALAQGPVQAGGFDVQAAGSQVRKNAPTSGLIPGGGTVERSVVPDLGAGPLLLALKRPDATTASRVAAAINSALGAEQARALDPAAVEVQLTEKWEQDAVGLLSRIEGLDVDADQRAKVVVSERTGTVVAGERVRIRPVAVAHGGLQVNVRTTPLVSQPQPFARQGATVTTEQADVSAAEQPGAAVALPATTTVSELVKALNLLGASPRDLIAILQAMRAAGALDADLEVL